MAGGMAAANTGGARFLRFGDVRRNTLGLKLVLADENGTVQAARPGMPGDGAHRARCRPGTEQEGDDQQRDRADREGYQGGVDRRAGAARQQTVGGRLKRNHRAADEGPRQREQQSGGQLSSCLVSRRISASSSASCARSFSIWRTAWMTVV